MVGRAADRDQTIRALIPDEDADTRARRLKEEYAAMEKRWPDPATRPPLFGLLLGVKDIFHTAQFPTRGGSSFPAEAFTRPGAPGLPKAEEAESVRRMREAGALIIGKTVSTEFAYFAPGPTANPLNPGHTPGGSSSGSAAAVAAGYCHAALGTQTIGSITRPASFCGVTGYKPSSGRIDTDGVIPFSPTADHVGVIAADVATASRCAAVLVRDWHAESADTTHAAETIVEARSAKSPEKGISAVPPGLRDLLRTRIGPVLVPDDAYLDQADADGLRGLDAAVERLSGLGVPIQRVSIMDDIAEINAAHTAMIAREFAEVHRFWETEFGKLYHERSRDLISRGSEIDDSTYRAAVAGGPVFRERLEAALERHGASLWLAPATTGEAPESLAATGNPIMNLPWTYAGLPTVSIPVYNLPHGRGPAGLPLGIQLATATHGRDEWLFYAVTLIEAGSAKNGDKDCR